MVDCIDPNRLEEIALKFCSELPDFIDTIIIRVCANIPNSYYLVKVRCRGRQFYDSSKR